MTPDSARKLQAFFRSLADTQQSLLLLDYDGTLAGFRLDRFKARPWAGVRDLLKKIQIEGRSRIAIITGRPGAEISPMLALESPIEVWGLHGAERIYPDGRRALEEAAPETMARLEELRQHLRRDALGGLFEDKPNAVVMHWRGQTAKSAQAIERRTRALFEPVAKLEGLRLLRFESGIELRAGRDKGGAVQEILRESTAGIPVAYLGDDLTDEAAFEAVNSAAGPHLSVLVRHEKRKTAADVWLKPPDELRMFLKRWLEAQKN